MGPVHCLQVHLRVEIAIIDDYCIRTGQIYAEASCSGTQKEDEVLISGHEGLYLAIPAFHVGASINAAKFECP
jgi:hypothetical protein